MNNQTRNSRFSDYPTIKDDLLVNILHAQDLKLKKIALTTSIFPFEKKLGKSLSNIQIVLERALYFGEDSLLLFALEKIYKRRLNLKTLLSCLKTFNLAWETKTKTLFKLKEQDGRFTPRTISLHDFYANSTTTAQKKLILILKNSFRGKRILSSKSLLTLQKPQNLPEKVVFEKKKAIYMDWARERLSVPGHALYFLRSLMGVFTSRGLKKKSYSLVIRGFTYFKQKNKIKLPTTSVLDMLLLRLRFHFKFKKYNLSRHRTVLLPYPLTEYQRLDNIAAQLKKALAKRKEKTFTLRLSNELEDFFNKKGNLWNLDMQYWKQLNESKNNYRYLKYAKKK